MIKRTVTKIFTFDSAHHLENYDGKCKYTHGHTYKLEVSVKGSLDESGFIVDFNELNDIVKENIISKLDHKYLNKVVEFNPTCELLVDWIYKELKLIFQEKRYKLNKIVLWETPTCFATIYEEEDKNEG